MNTLTKTSLRILPGVAALLAVALSAATPASALISMNGIKVNALVDNGIKFNAVVPNIIAPNALVGNVVSPNAAQESGAAFDFDAATVTSVTLPAEAE